MRFRASRSLTCAAFRARGTVQATRRDGRGVPVLLQVLVPAHLPYILLPRGSRSRPVGARRPSVPSSARREGRARAGPTPRADTCANPPTGGVGLVDPVRLPEPRVAPVQELDAPWVVTLLVVTPSLPIGAIEAVAPAVKPGGDVITARAVQGTVVASAEIGTKNTHKSAVGRRVHRVGRGSAPRAATANPSR